MASPAIDLVGWRAPLFVNGAWVSGAGRVPVVDKFTGEPIGIPRLLARPTATLSLEAQERRERVQKLYGD